MLCKLVFFTSLAVGVLGRTMFDYPYGTYDPYQEYSRKIATEYCKATNAEDKVPQVQASIETFAKCLINEIDANSITRDFETTRENQAYDDIIKKYCSKAPQLKDCARALLNGMSPCLPPGEVRKSERSLFTMVDFLCDNDGAKIITFLKEDGPQCFQDKQLELTFCQRQMQVNITTVASQYGDGAAGALKIPDMEKCRLVENALSCFTNEMNGCSNKIPGQLVGELQDLYLNNSDCTGEIYESQTEAVVENVSFVPQALVLSSGINRDIDFLMKRKLELEVRTAELEIWNRENELNIKHTSLTSDVQNN